MRGGFLTAVIAVLDILEFVAKRFRRPTSKLPAAISVCAFSRLACSSWRSDSEMRGTSSITGTRIPFAGRAFCVLLVLGGIAHPSFRSYGRPWRLSDYCPARARSLTSRWARTLPQVDIYWKYFFARSLASAEAFSALSTAASSVAAFTGSISKFSVAASF